MRHKKTHYKLLNEELYIGSALENMTPSEWNRFIEEVSNAKICKVSVPLLKHSPKTIILCDMIAAKEVTQLTLSHAEKCTTLGRLNYQWVDNANIPTDEFQFFKALLAATKNTLISIKFSKQEFNHLSLSGLIALKNALTPLKLQSLSLSTCELGGMPSAQCCMLISVFKEIKTITTLKLPSNHLYQWSRENLTLLAQVIHVLSLKYLDLKCNELCNKNKFGYEFFNLMTEKINVMDCVNFSANGVENLFAFEKKDDSQSLALFIGGLNRLPLGCLFIMNDKSFINEISPTLPFQLFFWASRTLQANTANSKSDQNTNCLSKIKLYSTSDTNRKAARHMLLIAVFLYFLYQGGQQSQYDFNEIKGYLKADKTQDSESFDQLARANSIHLIKNMASYHNSHPVCSRQHSTSFPYETIMHLIYCLCTPEQAAGICYTLNRLELARTGLSFFKKENVDMCFQRASSEMATKKSGFAF